MGRLLLLYYSAEHHMCAGSNKNPYSYYLPLPTVQHPLVSHLGGKHHRADASAQVLVLIVGLHVAHALRLLPPHTCVDPVEVDPVLQAVVTNV